MIPVETVAQAHAASVLETAYLCGASKNTLKRKGSELNGPCPACGGRDRFWLNEAENVFLCRASGEAGDAIVLIRHKHGCSFAEAVEMLTGEHPVPAATQAPSSKSDDNKFREWARKDAWDIWRSGRAIDPSRGGHLVVRYLAIRGIAMPDWHIRALREVDNLAYWHKRAGEQHNSIIHRGPAMLAAITGPDGHFIGVHRTWLDLSRPNGKAVIADPDTGEVLDAKKVWGTQRGGKIVLRDGEHGAGLTLGEGIETVFSWRELRNDRTSSLWCGINLDNISGKALGQIPHPSLTIKDSLGRVRKAKVGSHEPDLTDGRCLALPADRFSRAVLIGDGDSDRFSTQAAMLRARKRHALTVPDCLIDWADDGADFNDMLRRLRERRPERAVA